MSASTVGHCVLEVRDRRKDRVVLRGLDGSRGHECIAQRLDRLGVGSIDLDEIPAEAFDLFDRHVRVEFLDHVATEGRPLEHLEHEGRHDHPDADDQRSDDRQLSTSRLHDTPVRGPIRPVPIVGPPRPPLQGRRSRIVDRTVRARSDLDEDPSMTPREPVLCGMGLSLRDAFRREPRTTPSDASADAPSVVGGGGRESNPPDGDRPSQPL